MTNTGKRPTEEKQKTDDQFQSLLDTVEQLRKAKYSHLNAGLVREILRLHAGGTAAESELARAVEQAVEGRLAKES